MMMSGVRCALEVVPVSWGRLRVDIDAAKLDPIGDVGRLFQHITSANTSFWDTFVGASDTDVEGRNASALDTLCACGRPAKCGEGWTDAPSALERPLGMERVLRRRLVVGGERATSGTSVGPGGGVLKTEPGRKEWTDMRGRRPVRRVLRFGLEGGMDVEERSSAVWPDAPGAESSRRL